MKNLIKSFRKRDIFLLLLCLIFVVVQVYLDLKIPDFMSDVTEVIKGANAKVGSVVKYGGYMLLCALGSAISSVIVGFCVSIMASSFGMNVRSKIFNKVQDFSMSEIKDFSTASLITRSTNDVRQVQMSIAMGLQGIIKAPILAVWAILKIVNKGWQWSTATAVAILILLLVICMIIVIALPKFKKIQSLTDRLNSVSRESLTGVRVVRAFNAEEYEQNKYQKANDDITNTARFTQRVSGIIFPVMTLVMSGLNLAIYWIGAFIINKASFSNKLGLFSDMVVFSSYAMQVVFAFIMTAFIIIMLPRAIVSLKRINEVLNKKSSIESGNFSGELKKQGEVEFKNVDFKYPDAEEYVLKDISFTAKKGEVVAFIGCTGSGKSTLINLIPRFYDATNGEVLIDGKNVKDFTLQSLHDKIGYVSQKAVIFRGSIKDNMKLGDTNNQITDENIAEGLDISQSSEFVNKLKDGVDTMLEQGGKNVSGGQKQRISIARAVARKPEIFIFDDTFSALDYKTDKMLRQSLKTKLKDSTCLIVAQRIGTIKDADKIIVLDNGNMVGMGTHDELMKNCPVYQEIALSQLSKEELE